MGVLEIPVLVPLQKAYPLPTREGGSVHPREYPRGVHTQPTFSSVRRLQRGLVRASLTHNGNPGRASCRSAAAARPLFTHIHSVFRPVCFLFFVVFTFTSFFFFS